ncbi:type IV CRISPR-associated protein Csf2 [Xanthobacter aminoxidans]|uniref:Type IV CRISPR-associated protein Csf2 n=1 Tax=Xanthobacter aminoxidans TaxID=186280 RepID=A0ABW6ZNK1_9HYPH
MSYVIHGVLTTLSPLHITEPGTNYVNFEGFESSYLAKGKNLFPAMVTRRQYIGKNAFPVGGLVESGAAEPERTAGFTRIPVIPANSIRGRLRRCAAREYYDALLEKGQSLSVKAYNVMQCGAATGNPDGSSAPFDDILAGEAHAYFGLFGGGTRIRRSNLRVDEAWAVTPATHGFVPYVPVEYVAGAGHSLTRYSFKRRNDDLLSLADSAYQTRILGEDHRHLIGEYQDSALRKKEATARKKGKAAGADAQAPSEEVSEAEGEKEEKLRGLQSFTAVESVNPGVHFSLRFEVNGGPRHAGLLLVALQRWVREQRIGGLGQIGFGRFAVPELVIRRSDGASSDVFGPALGADPGDRRLADSSLIQEVMDAWNEARDGADAAVIEELSGSLA